LRLRHEFNPIGVAFESGLWRFLNGFRYYALIPVLVNNYDDEEEQENSENDYQYRRIYRKKQDEHNGYTEVVPR